MLWFLHVLREKSKYTHRQLRMMSQADSDEAKMTFCVFDCLDFKHSKVAVVLKEEGQQKQQQICLAVVPGCSIVSPY